MTRPGAADVDGSIVVGDGLGSSLVQVTLQAPVPGPVIPEPLPVRQLPSIFPPSVKKLTAVPSMTGLP
jgi:hypothetical protein